MWICIVPASCIYFNMQEMLSLIIFRVRSLRVCPFNSSGQFQGLKQWNGQQVWLTRFFFFIAKSEVGSGTYHTNHETIFLSEHCIGCDAYGIQFHNCPLTNFPMGGTNLSRRLHKFGNGYDLQPQLVHERR